MKVGLNLYSLRQSVCTKDDFLKTCQKLATLGYDYIQCSKMSLKTEEMKEVSDKTKLPIILTHSPLERFTTDLDNLVKEHDILNCHYMGVGMIDKSKIQSYKDALETVKLLEKIAINAKKKGKKFLYHNHNFEFLKYQNGKSFYDILIENTQELGFIFDTYWIQMGGANILEYITRLNGRIDCVHLKDFKVDGMTPRFAAIGDGNINFHNIIKEMKKSGTKYYFVEQDDAETYDDPFDELNKSIKYLKKLEV